MKSEVLKTSKTEGEKTLTIMSAAKHFHVAGWVPCSDYVQSKSAITGIATLFPNNVTAKIYECKKFLRDRVVFAVFNSQILNSKLNFLPKTNSCVES